MLQILSGAKTPDQLLPEGMVIPLPKDKTVEVSFTGGLLGIEHPLHLHGVSEPLLFRTEMPNSHIGTNIACL